MIIKRVIDVTEKCFLVTIALFTVGAMAQEVILLIEQRSVALKCPSSNGLRQMG